MGSLTQNFMLQVAKGKISGHSAVHISGHIHSLTSTSTPIWEAGVDPFPAAAGVVKISSSSTDDDVGGDGALTVLIEGLDSTGLEITETVILNGRTAVNTTKEFLRINRMCVLTAGSDNKNAGDIWAGTGIITNGVPATKYQQIGATKNYSLSAFYTIPLNKKGYLLSVFSGVSANLGASVDVMIRESGGLYNVIQEFHYRLATSPLEYNIPPELDALTDILISAEVDAGTGDLSAGFHLLLIED